MFVIPRGLPVHLLREQKAFWLQKVARELVLSAACGLGWLFFFVCCGRGESTLEVSSSFSVESFSCTQCY